MTTVVFFAQQWGVYVDLIAEGLSMLAERRIEFAGRFIPPLMASFGCHCFNLVNRDKQVFYHQGRLPDCRLQVLFTAPPGFAKSLFLKQLVKPKYGILWNDKIPELMMLQPYPSNIRASPSRPAFRFMGSCTEAGWTGSVDGSGPNASKAIGQAEKYRNGLFAMEEFKAITQIMNQEHSGHLEQMINMSLFEGDVEKDLKSLTISYHTDVTVWAGNQVMNFDISGGLFRRFLPMLWIPRLWEAERLKDVIWEGDNVRLNEPRLDAFRGEVAKFYKALRRVRSVKFDRSVRDGVREAVHYEQLILRNLALGYTLMCESDVPRDVVVGMTPKLKDVIADIMAWRHQLLSDPRGYQIIALVYDLAGKGWVDWNLVREKNLLYSTSFETTDSVIRVLLGQRRLDYNSGSGQVRIA